MRIDSRVEISALNINSVNDLAHRLGIRRDVLESIAAYAGAHYAPFAKTNTPRPFQRKPFLKKIREIDNPLNLLKDIQERINAKLLRQIELPDHLYGGRKGRSIIQNAKRHLASKVLVTIDVKRFFPSISNRNIYSVWTEILGCSPKVASILTRLTTFERRLPQGAPTSTTLANLHLLSCDEAIRHFCRENGINYTSWVDDLAFSGKSSRSVINIVAAALRVGGLRISRRKVNVMPASRRQVLTGIAVNKKPRVAKEYCKAIRSGIHKLRTGHIRPNLVENYVKSLRGKIGYINQFDSAIAARLTDELRTLVD